MNQFTSRSRCRYQLLSCSVDLFSELHKLKELCIVNIMVRLLYTFTSDLYLTESFEVP